MSEAKLNINAKPSRAGEVAPSVDTAVHKQIRTNKYLYLFVLQGYYDADNGWEDLTASEDEREINTDLQAYRANEGGRYRIVKRRDPNERE